MSMRRSRLRVVWSIVGMSFAMWFQVVGADESETIIVSDEVPILHEYLDGHDCVVHDFTPVGQVLHASGSVGGLAPYSNRWVQGVTTTAELQTINPDAAVLEAVGQRVDNVIIVVLDDFQYGYEFSFDPGFDAEQVLQNISHGALVMAHVNTLVRESGYTIDPNAQKEGTVWTKNGKNAQVVGVQLKGISSDGYIVFDLEEFRNQIAPYMDLPDDTSAVMNMSWVILPCRRVAELAAHFDESDLPTFQDYLNALRLATEATSLAWDESRLSNLLDPVSFATDHTDRLMDGVAVTFIASSGNQGLDFELFPAAFPDVISVGARGPHSSGAAREAYSNAARVLATGGWFPLAYLEDSADVLPDGLAYAGTSFAAPSMSVLAALLADDCVDVRNDELRERTNGAAGVVLTADLCN